MDNHPGSTTVRLNNIGASILSYGNSQKALDLFCDALVDPLTKFISAFQMETNNAEMIKTRLTRFLTTRQHVPKTTTTTTTPQPKEYGAGSIATNDVTSNAAEYLSLTKRDNNLPQESNKYFVHAQGIAISDCLVPDLAPELASLPSSSCATTICNASSSPDNLLFSSAIASAILLFNMGLVYHLKGLEEETDRVRRLERAKYLYSKSSTILQNIGIPLVCVSSSTSVSASSSTGNIILDLLSMALINNLGHVSYELFDYPQSRILWNTSLQFLRTVDVTTYRHSTLESLMLQQRFRFYLNAVIFLHLPTSAAAA